MKYFLLRIPSENATKITKILRNIDGYISIRVSKNGLENSLEDIKPLLAIRYTIKSDNKTSVIMAGYKIFLLK